MLKHQSLNLLVGEDGQAVIDPDNSIVQEKTGKHVPYEVPTEDITKNLFKVCCAVMNLRPKQRMVNPLEEEILHEHLDPIEELQKGTGPIGATGHPDSNLVEQLQVLRSLV